MPKLPGVNHRDAVRAFGRMGYWVVRQGKHIVMTDGKNKVVIPRNDPINAFTLGRIVTDAGVTIEQFKRLL